MKSSFKLISAILLLSATSLVFADNIKCPSTKDLRNNVKLTKAADLGSTNRFKWMFSSDPFAYNVATWNVIFNFTGLAVPSSVEALEYGQKLFNTSILKEPVVTQLTDSRMICDYSIEGANYTVIAVSPANYGFRKS